MDLKALLVRLDKGSRFLDRFGLGVVRRTGRRWLESTSAQPLSANLGELTLSGGIQHRTYLQRLERGLAEPYTADLLAQATSPGCTFVDIGAFLGFYTLRAAAAGACVLSFEPNPETRTHLERNIDRNALGDRITLFPLALSSRAEEIEFFVGDGDQSSAGMAPTRSNTRPIVIEARPLDDLVEHADVIKIDVEGAETRVLTGMSRLLARRRPMTLVAECNPAGLARLGASPRELVEHLEKFDFRVLVVDERNRELLPWNDDLEPEAGYVNLYATR